MKKYEQFTKEEYKNFVTKVNLIENQHKNGYAPDGVATKTLKEAVLILVWIVAFKDKHTKNMEDEELHRNYLTNRLK